MHMDIKNYLLILFGWLVRVSYELECIQCTSSIERPLNSWTHSCLEGTLSPMPCQESNSNSTAPLCVSALYRGGQRGRAGVLISRGCKHNYTIQHDCDPPSQYIDIESEINFYCSLTCLEDGCNRHAVAEILPNASALPQTTKLLYLICTEFLFYFTNNVFS